MKIYPYSKLTCSSQLNTYEIKMSLRSYVEKVANPSFDLFAPHAHSTLFGSVGEGDFQIYRTRLSNSRPTTVVYGQLRKDLHGNPTAIELTYTLNFYKAIFYFLWHGFFLGMLALLTRVSVDNQAIWLFPVLFLIGGNRVMIRKFEADIEFFNRFFTESIAAEWQSKQTPRLPAQDPPHPGILHNAAPENRTTY